MISYRRVQKESDELSLYGLVARYGPQSVAKRKWLIVSLEFVSFSLYLGLVAILFNYLFILFYFFYYLYNCRNVFFVIYNNL